MCDGPDDIITQEDVDLLIDDMHKLVMLPGEKIIHVLPQEYIIDGEQGITKPVGMSGVRLEANFHIITGQESAKNNIIRCVQKVDLDVSDLVLEPLASAEAVLNSEEKEGGVALIDIGGGTTDIAIFYDNIIRHTAVIPFGGSSITEDIKEGCAILRKQAEQLKVKFGSALADQTQENEIVAIPGIAGADPREISVKNLSSIIQARMSEIMEYADHEIKNSGYHDKLIAGIVLTGGGSQLKHIAQLCEYITGLRARVGYPNQFLAQGDIDAIASPLFATSVGLVIKGFETMEKVRSQGKGQKVTGHSTKKRGNFFDSFFKTTQEFFEEKDVDADEHK
jgi:cell division protein FtsA